MDMALDITRLVGRRLKGRHPTGVDRVGLAYVEHFGRGAAPGAWALVRLAGRWLFFSPREAQALYAGLLGGSGPSRAALAWAVARRALLGGGAAPRRGAWLLNVVHSGLDRADYARRVEGLGLRAVCFLHDLIPITHPQYSRAGEGERHRRRVQTALCSGAALIVNSRDTLEAVRLHARTHGLPMPPAVVAPLAPAELGPARLLDADDGAHRNSGDAGAAGAARGAGDVREADDANGAIGANGVSGANGARNANDADDEAALHTAARRAAGSSGPAPASRPYFLMLGTLEPRKNHAAMLRLWRERLVPLGEAAPELVVIGQPGWLCEEVRATLAAADADRDRVRWIAACDDAELAGWLGGARALLFPSHVEGYGLPLVEALSMGVPVIASDLPVFHEIAGDVPDYLAPDDEAGWARLIADHARADSGARAAQCRRLADFCPPCWPSHFARVEALLEAVHACD